MSGPLRLAAPAKLNLWLSVTGRRADGLHELSTAVVLLELADRVLLMPGAPGLRVEGASGDVPIGAENLAWRGLTAGLGGEPELACLALEKRIPSAAGLGGGSSDAAAAWRLGRAWRGVTGPAPAAEIAALASIGADVPFFASLQPAALLTGVGERIEPMPAPDPPLEVVLVHPPFSLATAAVYAELRPAEWSRGSAPEAGHNDLLPAARRLAADLDAIMAAVAAAGGEPRLTGSGPTVFVLTDDPERAAGIARRLSRAGLAVTRTHTRTEAATIEAVTDPADGEV